LDELFYPQEKIKVCDATFVDIFNFVVMYVEDVREKMRLGDTYLYYIDGNNWIANRVEQTDMRKGEPNPNGHVGYGAEDFDISKHDYYVSIKSSGGYYSWVLTGNLYKEKVGEL